MPVVILGLVFGLVSPCLGQLTNVEVVVPGYANPWLAGMAPGSRASNCSDGAGDSSPAQSPVEVPGLPMLPGLRLSFTATGSVANGPLSVSPASGPRGLDVTIAHPAENGLSGLSAPLDALVGVFVGAEDPNLSSAPGTVSGSVEGPVPGRAYPALKQPFLIGDGVSVTAHPLQFVVPRGARRLYLGVLDGCGYYNNVGAFQVQVRVEELPSLQIEVSEVRVSWVGRPGVRYQLEVRDLEGGGPWVPSGEPFLGDGAVHTLADRVNPASRLYRIVEKAP